MTQVIEKQYQIVPSGSSVPTRHKAAGARWVNEADKNILCGTGRYTHHFGATRTAIVEK